MKVLVGAFNKEKALLCETSEDHIVVTFILVLGSSLPQLPPVWLVSRSVKVTAGDISVMPYPSRNLATPAQYSTVQYSTVSLQEPGDTRCQDCQVRGPLSNGCSPHMRCFREELAYKRLASRSSSHHHLHTRGAQLALTTFQSFKCH